MDLLARYAEQDRAYHTAGHLASILQRVDELGGCATDIRAVRYAAWFHDAVYDPHRGDNEATSADLAAYWLRRFETRPGTVAEVVRLVLLTAGHRPEPGDRNGAVLCDADLAVLGSTTEGYRAYLTGVRSEYRHVEEAAWRIGRGQVLRSLLDRPRIFHTPVGFRRYEDSARANLGGELRALGGLG